MIYMNPALQLLGRMNWQKERVTHRPREVPLKLLNDRRETSAGHVQELPTPAHRRPIPSRGRMLLQRGDIALLLMVQPKLNKSPELEGVREEERNPVYSAHG